MKIRSAQLSLALAVVPLQMWAQTPDAQTQNQED